MKLVVLWPDTHRPFHHKRACGLVHQVLSTLSPDEIVILGDFADFYSVSSHPKDPTVLSMLKTEVESVITGLQDFDRLYPRAKKVFIAGNHEHRLERYLVDKAPALFGLTSIPHLFEIQNKALWSYVPYGPNQAYKPASAALIARHEPLGQKAWQTAQRALYSVCYGHVHRIEESHIVAIDGSNFTAFSVGWLGDKRKDKVFGYVKNHHQWQLGFGLVYVEPTTGQFYHQLVHIHEDAKGNVSCVVNGKKFKG